MMKETADQRAFRKISVFGNTRGEDRRILILRAAISSLNTLGMQDTTFESIAKLAKMQRSHVAYYFKTRDELILTTVRFVIATAQELTIDSVVRAESPSQRIAAIVHAFFDQAAANPKHFAIWILFWNLAAIDPAYRLLHQEICQIGQQRIEQVLELHQAGKGTNRSALAALAAAIQALGFGFFVQAADNPTVENIREQGKRASKAALELMESWK